MKGDHQGRGALFRAVNLTAAIVVVQCISELSSSMEDLVLTRYGRETSAICAELIAK
jgi:hypothetical protein